MMEKLKILLSCNHIYPAAKPKGTGTATTNYPSGSGNHQHDLLAKGLAEKGHEVLYHIQHDPTVIAPAGITFVNHFVEGVDLVHVMSRVDDKLVIHYQQQNIPILATNHLYKADEKPPFKWVHVSKTLADLYHEKQYVWCGLDPADYLFSIHKQDYFLFISDMSRHQEKGLDIALELSKKRNLKLVVAGSSRNQNDIDKVKSLCNTYNATYVGDVRGKQKAELLANACAVISPSRLPESFGITLAEALFSGTPVICSNVGAYGEITTPEVGFVCNNDMEYLHAVDHIQNIDPKACRDYAMTHFHYHNTTEKYINIYKEILALQPAL
jgi:glycosyltransferase involved in cell wall biosynthesis